MGYLEGRLLYRALAGKESDVSGFFQRHVLTGNHNWDVYFCTSSCVSVRSGDIVLIPPIVGCSDPAADVKFRFIFPF